MFLHSGAGLHGHEYSTRKQKFHEKIPKALPFLRPTPAQQPVFSPRLSADKARPLPMTITPSTSSPHPSHSPFSHAPKPSCIRSKNRSQLDFTARTTEQVVRFKEPHVESNKSPTSCAGDATQSPDHLVVHRTRAPVTLSPSLSNQVSLLGPRLPMASSLASYTRSGLKANPLTSDDDTGYSSCSDHEHANLDAGPTVHRRSTKRRIPRPSTKFLVAYPAPRQKITRSRLIQARPQLLLQLQQLCHDRRPRPALDVFPASITASSRLSQRFSLVFKLQSSLAAHDVLILKSEDYEAFDDDHGSDEDEEGLGRRELMAVLSPIPKDERFEIAFADGSVWVATPLSSGSFEFVHSDPLTGRTTTARWVRRASKPSASFTTGSLTSNPVVTSSPSPHSKYRYTFSIINPNTRRHPVLAALTHEYLEVLESYETLSGSSGRYPPTAMHMPPTPNLSDDDDELRAHSIGRKTRPVDLDTRRLISITAVWVALHLGWSPYYKSAAAAAAASAVGAIAAVAAVAAAAVTTASIAPPKRPSNRVRSWSANSEVYLARLSPKPMLTLPRSESLRGRGRTRTPVATDVTANTPFSSTVAIDELGQQNPRPPFVKRRATSTGAAFMQQHVQQQRAGEASTSTLSLASVGRRSRGHSLRASWRTRLITGEGRELQILAEMDPANLADENKQQEKDSSVMGDDKRHRDEKEDEEENEVNNDNDDNDNDHRHHQHHHYEHVGNDEQPATPRHKHKPAARNIAHKRFSMPTTLPSCNSHLHSATDNQYKSQQHSPTLTPPPSLGKKPRQRYSMFPSVGGVRRDCFFVAGDQGTSFQQQHVAATDGVDAAGTTTMHNIGGSGHGSSKKLSRWKSFKLWARKLRSH